MDSQNMLLLAAKLQELQAQENYGIGVSCVRSISLYLERGDYQSACAVRQNDGKKIASYPALEKAISESMGCRRHLQVDCKSLFCNPKLHLLCRILGIHKWMLLASRALPFGVYEAKLECDRCKVQKTYRDDGF